VKQTKAITWQEVEAPYPRYEAEGELFDGVDALDIEVECILYHRIAADAWEFRCKIWGEVYRDAIYAADSPNRAQELAAQLFAKSAKARAQNLRAAAAELERLHAALTGGDK
jgi:hypothetical protein